VVAGATLVLVALVSEVDDTVVSLTDGVVIFGRLDGFTAVELSKLKGCGFATFPLQTKLPLIATALKSGHVKLGAVDWTLKLPLTTARLGRAIDWKFPVISTFPLTALRELNPSILLTFGFRLSTRFEPIVVRFGKLRDVKVA
jgi:hypothetical protein